MSHFAELDENNTVIRVVVCDDSMPNEGYEWLVETFSGCWIKTSYNTIGGIHLNGGIALRKNFAGIGFTYDYDRDAFIPPYPGSGYVLNENSCLWIRE